MKKILMIGSLLIMGALSYGAVSNNLATTGGDASLPIKTDGTVLSAANKALLVITPTASAGASGDTLDFDFGSMQRGDENTLVGKFEAQVITGDTTRKTGTLTSQNIKVTLKKGETKQDSFDNQVKTTKEGGMAGETVAVLKYELTKASGIVDSGNKYSGEVAVTAAITGDNQTGTFIDTGVSVNITITDIELTAQTS